MSSKFIGDVFINKQTFFLYSDDVKGGVVIHDKNGNVHYAENFEKHKSNINN